MNTHIKSALNKINAEEELLKKTDSFLRANLEKPADGNTIKIKFRSVDHMKKILAASIAAVFVFGAVLAGGIRYNQKNPIAYVSLDINPSVELGVNASDIVVTAESENEDGQVILENQEIINKDISEALTELINSASENNYINERCV